MYIHKYVTGCDSYSIYTSDRLQGKYAREQVYYTYMLHCLQGNLKARKQIIKFYIGKTVTTYNDTSHSSAHIQGRPFTP